MKKQQLLIFGGLGILALVIIIGIVVYLMMDDTTDSDSDSDSGNAIGDGGITTPAVLDDSTPSPSPSPDPSPSPSPSPDPSPDPSGDGNPSAQDDYGTSGDTSLTTTPPPLALPTSADPAPATMPVCPSRLSSNHVVNDPSTNNLGSIRQQFSSYTDGYVGNTDLQAVNVGINQNSHHLKSCYIPSGGCDSTNNYSGCLNYAPYCQNTQGTMSGRAVLYIPQTWFGGEWKWSCVETGGQNGNPSAPLGPTINTATQTATEIYDGAQIGLP